MSEGAPEDKDWKRAHELHDKYRASGLALSVIIATLSGGAINIIRPQAPGKCFILFLPIALSIAHQFCLYMGERHEARAVWKWFEARMQADAIDKSGVQGIDRIEMFVKKWGPTSGEGFEHGKASTTWFTRADYLCFLAAGSFLICGFIAVTQLPVISGLK